MRFSSNLRVALKPSRSLLGLEDDGEGKGVAFSGSSDNLASFLAPEDTR